MKKKANHQLSRKKFWRKLIQLSTQTAFRSTATCSTSNYLKVLQGTKQLLQLPSLRKF